MSFVGVWTLMMAAMMLPSITPFAVLITRTIANERGRRLATYGAYCLACRWPLMALLVAVGLMNVLAMVALARLEAQRGDQVVDLAGAHAVHV